MCESAFGVGEQFGWLIKKGKIFCRKYWREQLTLRIISTKRVSHTSPLMSWDLWMGVLSGSRNLALSIVFCASFGGKPKVLMRKRVDFMGACIECLSRIKGISIHRKNPNYTIAFLAYCSPSSNAFLFSSTTFAGTFEIIVS